MNMLTFFKKLNDPFSIKMGKWDQSRNQQLIVKKNYLQLTVRP